MERLEAMNGTSGQELLSTMTTWAKTPVAVPRQTAKHLVSGWLGIANGNGLQTLLVLLSEMSGLSPDTILNGKVRTPREVKTRQLLWASLRRYANLSYPEIGALVGKSHTTIMHGVKRVPDDVLESVGEMLKGLDMEDLIL